MAIKQDIEIHPPFEEMASVREARERALRMAKSDLPVVVEGEPGTGRRTLAAVLVLMRETQHSASSLQLQGTDGIDDRFRKKLEAARERDDLSFKWSDHADQNALIPFLFRLIAISQRLELRFDNLLYVCGGRTC